MLPSTKFAVISSLLVFSAVATKTAMAAEPAPTSPILAYEYHSVVPLGEDALLLQPAKKSLYLMASAESRGFEGWRQVDSGHRHLVYSSAGSTVQHYPEFVDFRVTASGRRMHSLAETPLFPIPCKEELNQYLLALRFRLKIFHGLNVTQVEPKVVRMIGMPADVPYDERIYRVSFQLSEVPLEDRIVLEVLSSDGERISKFHLEFN